MQDGGHFFFLGIWRLKIWWTKITEIFDTGEITAEIPHRGIKPCKCIGTFVAQNLVTLSGLAMWPQIFVIPRYSCEDYQLLSGYLNGWSGENCWVCHWFVHQLSRSPRKTRKYHETHFRPYGCHRVCREGMWIYTKVWRAEKNSTTHLPKYSFLNSNARFVSLRGAMKSGI